MTFAKRRGRVICATLPDKLEAREEVTCRGCGLSILINYDPLWKLIRI